MSSELTTAAPLPNLTARPRTTQKNLLQRIWLGRVSYLMLLPILIPFIIFIIVPLFQSALISLHDYSPVSPKPAVFVGTDNYQTLLSLQIQVQPALYDDTSGERMYQCGRRRYPQSEVAAQEADGEVCAAAFVSARDLLTEGYRELSSLTLLETRYVIGAKDTRFWTAIINTLIFVLYTVLLKLVFGFAVALALRKQTKLNYLLRLIFFLPSVTASIAVIVVWGWVFRGASYGFINHLLMQAGIVSEPIPFLNDAAWTMPILILITVWGGIGYTMILFLAGMQNINPELYEIASIDGASPWAMLHSITIPLLRPTTLYVVITSIIGGFQVFEGVYILFSSAEGMGGVLDSGLTVVPYLYDEGFRLFNMGYASAIAWLLFAVIFVLTLINLRVGRADEAY